MAQPAKGNQFSFRDVEEVKRNGHSYFIGSGNLSGPYAMKNNNKFIQSPLFFIWSLLIAMALPSCGGGGTTASSSSPTTTSSTTTTSTATSTTMMDEAVYSPLTNYSNDFCSTSVYPAQWTWNPATIQTKPEPATTGTPMMKQIRNGVVIATFNNLGGDAGYSFPNSQDGQDPSKGPFRRTPYTQWRSGDVFEIYPAVYSGPTMQIYIGRNIANDAAYTAGNYDTPANITIRGVTVNGKRPVIVNPPGGASNSNYGQSLVYVEAASNITIENIDIVDAPTGGNLGKAAIYANGAANLTLRNVRIAGFKQHHANGIFGTSNNTGTLLLENVELDGNGGSSGPEHNAYINASATDPNYTFHVKNSWSHSSYYGHALKSRAQRTVVEGSYLSGDTATAGQQTETYLLDVPDGGVLIARNNIFVKGFSGDNSNGASLTFGVESQNPGRTWGLTVEHNTFVALSRFYDTQNHRLYPLFLSSLAPGPRVVDANLFVGYCATGNTSQDFRGTKAATLNFNQIDLAFRPRTPQLTGNPAIVGTPRYSHLAVSSTRTTAALGARD